MKTDNHDIISMVRQLRDEENEALRVSPWKRHRHFQIPSWLVAIPAAAVAGFILGLWCNDSSRLGEEKLSALVDTIYIEVPQLQASQDTALAEAARSTMTEAAHSASPSAAVSATAAHPSVRSPRPSRRQQPSIGRPVADDHIRYDLLVRN
jgi:hypothetical protein